VTNTLGPRVVIAGTHSGVGKTTVATGLMAALARRGQRVASAKVGPDFIDPGYHALATGRPGRNLDAWLSGADAIGPLAGRAAAGADVLVVEGVMGLFDGASDGTPASTADVAALLGAPVILVVDAAAMSQSVAALVHGFATLPGGAGRVNGVILNRVASDGHEVLLRDALEPLGLPVLGTLRRDDAFTWRDRHLGLVPVAERPDAVRAALDRLAAVLERQCDFEAVLRLAASAPTRTVAVPTAPVPLTGSGSDSGSASGSGRTPPRIALAAGPAFTFTYRDNVEALEAAGAEVVSFDPLHDPALPPDTDGLIVGGGFPEVYGEALAANEPLLADVRHRIGAGLPTWAECGGLLWLARSLDGNPMGGVVAADATMSGRLTLGYRTATVQRANPVVPVGSVIRGHEFHYSQVSPVGDALALTSRFGSGPEGHATPTLLATYLHQHLGADPAPAERFAAAAAHHHTSRRLCE
jgi:cobyrinic acid a,c-diamide synthase